MALFIIDIQWDRRRPEAGSDNTGTTIQVEYARNLKRATNQACGKFRRHYGAHRAITGTSQRTDLAIPKPSPLYVDCGSGQDYGICRKCDKGHGHVLIRDGVPTSLVTA